MKKQNLLLAVALLMPFYFASCKDDDDNGNGPSSDTTPPQVTIERPAEDEERTAGSHMHFRATFTDNEELGSFSLDIHEAFDGHGHGKNWAPFRYELRNQSLSGKEQYIDHDIDVPDNAIPGKYHLTIQATDAAGNSLNINGSTSKTLNFYIKNPDFSPSFDVSSPAHEAVFNEGETIELRATIDGNGIDIEEIFVKLIHEASGEVVYDWDADHLHTETYQLSRNITVDSKWAAGEYEIEIEVELENGLHYHLEPHLKISVE